MTEFEELDQYIDFLQRRGRKPGTIMNYDKNLRHVMRLLRDNGKHYLAAEVTEDDMAWLYMTLTDIKECTRKGYLRLLSNLVEYFTGVNLLKRTALLFNDDSGEVNVHYITLEQFKTLYEEGDAHDRMILVLGAFMGLRRAEMAAILMEDIHGDTMLIRGKGHGPNGKLVEMRIPERVKAEIADYLTFKELYPMGYEGSHLIETGSRHHVLRPTDPQSIGHRMNDLKHETGIQFTTHSLRRLYATTLYYDVGADLITIKGLMRHSKAETTITRYIAPMKKKETEAANSLDNLLCNALGEV